MMSRNYLITGAGKGIGRGLSRLLLQRGHKVFLLDIDQSELDHTTTQLSSTFTRGERFEAVVCNLRHLDELRGVVEQASKFFAGHLDVLINNAAYTGAVGEASAATITLDQWNASVETNLTAPLFLSQYCIPLLQKSEARSTGGTIIHMSSTRAKMAEPDNEGYSATKAGLLGLTNSMSISLGSMGIRVNAILPGWISVSNETMQADASGQSWSDGLNEYDHQWHSAGRVGRVEDILQAVEFLAESTFVTGQEIVVDGGVSRKMVYPE